MNNRAAWHWVATLGLAFACSLASVVANDRNASGQFGIVGYLPYYRMDGISNSIALHSTDIIYAFIWPKSNGSLDLGDLTPARIAKLQALKSLGARVSISVGGAGLSDNFGPATASAATRAFFVQQLLNLCRNLNLDGIDFDWEFPCNSTEEHNYALLLYETKQAFLPYGLLVTVALNADLTIDYQAMKSVGYSMVDRVHLMSYARANALGYHSTYSQSVIDVTTLLSVGGVPNWKLYLGMPFYGRCTDDFETYRTYAQIVTDCKDPADYVDLATYPGLGDIYFNGVDTIKQKTRYACIQQIGGIAIWELGEDTVGMKLLRAANDAGTNSPSMPVPDIKANDLNAACMASAQTPITIALSMDAANYAGTPVDWWVIGCAGSSWYYLNNSLQWTSIGGDFSQLRPVYQGALFNLPLAYVLSSPWLPAGSYTFWFAIDPLDGILNVNGPILFDSVNVAVQ